jgi:hypothetical protein
MTYTVKIVETNIGFLDFETEEEARNWMECPEDFSGITWSESMIEKLELREKLGEY